MKTLVNKHSVVINGHKTSISMEDSFWEGLNEIAKLSGKSLSDLVSEIDAGHKGFKNLSSVIRVFVYTHYKELYDQQKKGVSH